MSGKDTYQLACQLYSLRDLMQTPEAAAVTLKKVRKMGYRNVQVSGPVCGFDPAVTRAMCDAAGLRIIGAHVGLKDMEADLDAVVRKLAIWGCSYVAIPSACRDAASAQDWIRFALQCNGIGKKLLAKGIRLQYHNHAYEFAKFGRKGIKGGATGLQILYKNSNPKYLQAELDTCWVARGGGDPAVWCRSMKGRMDQVHLKDMVILNNEPVFCPIGEGNLNWPEILKACKAAGVRDYIIEQDEFRVVNDPLANMAASYQNLSKMGLK